MRSGAVNGTMKAMLALAHDKGVISSVEAARFTDRFRDEDCVNPDEGTKADRLRG